MALKGIPSLLNKLNAYKDGNKYIGTTGQFTLFNAEAKTTTIAGGGILGEFDMPVTGFYSTIEQEIPFRVVCDELYDLADPTEAKTIALHGAVQYMDPETHNLDTYGIRIVMKGLCKSVKHGNAADGDQMEASATLELTYALVEIDGDEVLCLDKINGDYRINGVDKLAKIKAQT